ncbi:MAG: LacI family DNA-binding transcriptional regulator [Pseudomonadota bacterium]
MAKVTPNSDRPKVTIYDVADEAGVAISTVSRVLNDSKEVSDKTRQKVEAAIEKLRFKPQRTAKTLAQQQTHSLAVAMPSTTSLYYVEILKGVKDTLREHDIDLLLCNLGSTSPYQTLQRFLARGAVDALLLASLPIDENLERELMKLHAPVVIAGVNHPKFDCIYLNDRVGGSKAVQHLIDQGHRRIGMISPHPWSYVTDERIQGYRNALEAAGIPFDPSLIAAGDTLKHAGFSEEAGAEAMKKLLSLAEPPTAVFVSSDVQAFGAWSEIRARGQNVPENMSIVAYDNLKLSRYLRLTTVDQKMYEVGKRATERLLQRMEKDTSERINVFVEPELIVRGSTSPAKVPA